MLLFNPRVVYKKAIIYWIRMGVSWGPMRIEEVVQGGVRLGGGVCQQISGGGIDSVVQSSLRVTVSREVLKVSLQHYFLLLLL